MLPDASALLVLLYEERGKHAVRSAVSEGAAISTVNVSEVAARMMRDGWKRPSDSSAIRSFNLEIIPVDWNVALLAAEYRALTQYVSEFPFKRLYEITPRSTNPSSALR